MMNLKKAITGLLVFVLMFQPVSVLGSVVQTNSNTVQTADFGPQHFDNIEPSSLVIKALTVVGIRRAVDLLVRNWALPAMSQHVLLRMAERGISYNTAARLFVQGQRFVNAAGQRILFDASTRTAIILDRTGQTAITAYNNVNLQQKMTGPQRWASVVFWP